MLKAWFRSSFKRHRKRLIYSTLSDASLSCSLALTGVCELLVTTDFAVDIAGRWVASLSLPEEGLGVALADGYPLYPDLQGLWSSVGSCCCSSIFPFHLNAVVR